MILTKSASSRMMRALLAFTVGTAGITIAPLPASATKSTLSLSIDGQPQSFPQPPVMIDDRVYVPVRALLEAFGYQVEWNSQERTVSASKESNLIQLDLKSQSVYVTEPLLFSKYMGSLPTKIYQGRSMIPARSISEMLGMDVQWDAQTQTVSIDSRKIQLIQAILHEDLPTVRNLLDSGVNPNGKRDTMTLLHYAVSTANPALVQLLLAKGASIESNEIKLALRLGYSEIIRILLTADNQQKTPAQLATDYLPSTIAFKSTEGVKALLALGADPKQAKGLVGDSALLMAVSLQNTEVIRDLLEKGADPNEDLGFESDYGHLLILAVKSGNHESIRLLLSHGANPNAHTKEGWTPLMFAAEHGNVAFVQTLLQNGADVGAKNAGGATALAIALARGNEATAAALRAGGASEPTTKQLPESALSFRVEASQDLTTAALEGRTNKVVPLLTAEKEEINVLIAYFCAVQSNRIETLQAMLETREMDDPLALWGAEQGADTLLTLGNEKRMKQKMPDHLLTSTAYMNNSNLAVYQALLDLGLKPGVTYHGQTDLTAATNFGQVGVVRLLLQAGADPNAFDMERTPALVLAVRTGHTETLKVLLSSDKVTQESKNKALIEAVTSGSIESASLLLQAGADANFQTTDGQSPLGIAKRNDNQEMIELLTQQ